MQAEMWYYTRMEQHRTREPREQKPDAIRLVRRGALYLVRTMMLILLGFVICILAFLTAERIGNIYIIASEGMALRANTILGVATNADLADCFTQTWLDRDGGLSDDTYVPYSVTSVSYELAVEKFNVLPLGSSATIDATERVKLKGTIRDEWLGEGERAADRPIPAWTPMRYRISFLNIDGRWYISDLTVLQEDPPEAAKGTPDLSKTPIVGATPSPVPSPTIKPLPISTARAEDVTIIG